MQKALKSKKIVIVSQSHACRNPRVVKEAHTLSNKGYKVYILTAIYSDELLKEDMELLFESGINYEYYCDLRRITLSALGVRAIRKIAVELQSKFQLESVASLGFDPINLLKKCAGYDADLYIMHQELATYTGIKLIKRGFKVAFDLEDWYSEDLQPAARRKRPINLLKKMEQAALQKGVFCTTTSQVLSTKLAAAYSSKPAGVIYNVFPSKINLLNNRNFSKRLKLFWFSQTIGAGRGIEQFLSLLAYIDAKIELHLLGNITDVYKKELEVLMHKRHGLYFHQLVKAKDLADKIAEFDIGLALELPLPLSRNYTITNKFFQYLQSGLPIIASDTGGQNEGFNKFKPGFILSQAPVEQEIEKLNRWLKDAVALGLAKDGAIKAAHFYNWENESKKLIKLVKKALDDAG